MAELFGWLYGQVLKDRWNMNDAEITDLILNYGLLPYDDEKMLPIDIAEEKEYMMSPDPFGAKDLVPTLKDRINICLFRLSDVEIFEREHPELFKKSEQTSEGTVFPCKPGTRWEDITIILLADDMVRIKTPQSEGRFTYHQLGFADKRKGDQPTMLWGLLKIFAGTQGRISRSEGVEYSPRLPDSAKRLDKHLQKIFGINERIYKGHYRAKKGYTTRFTLLDHRETGDW